MRLLKKTELRFYRKPLTADLPSIAAGRSFAVLGSYDDIPDLFLGNESVNEQYRHRFDLNHLPVVSYADGEPAHISWLAFGGIYIGELDYAWQLRGDQMCVYDCRTVAAFRGRGFYPDTLRWITEGGFHAPGATHAWIYALRGNNASLLGIEKAGFILQGTAMKRVILRRPAGNILWDFELDTR